ncbi:MAG TPA: hypothetical protein VIP70_12495 [Nitrososphaeraceae archaeon]
MLRSDFTTYAISMVITWAIMENAIRFNMNAMRMAWNNPFLNNLTQPKLENKE